MSLMVYLNFKTIKARISLPYTAGRYQKRSFQKVNWQYLRDSSTLSWAKAEIVGKSNWLSESWSNPWKSSTSLLARTQSRLLSMLMPAEVSEKNPHVLELVVSSEDKQSMSLQSEETTRQSPWSVKIAESQTGEPSRAWVKSLLKRSLLPPRVLDLAPTAMQSERRTKSRESARVTDEMTYLALPNLLRLSLFIYYG